MADRVTSVLVLLVLCGTMGAVAACDQKDSTAVGTEAVDQMRAPVHPASTSTSTSKGASTAAPKPADHPDGG